MAETPSNPGCTKVRDGNRGMPWCDLILAAYNDLLAASGSAEACEACAGRDASDGGDGQQCPYHRGFRDGLLAATGASRG